MSADPDSPPGWPYNPSAWGQRLPIIGWAMGGFALSSYLALYQFGIIPDVWEPFFGDGSRKVLDSELSRVLPIPDAALGAIGYLIDGVTGAIGGRRRWQSMPWMVVLFGLAVGPLGMISLLLVIAQPVVIGAWCTLCLLSAFIAILMIGPSMDEVLASLQYLKRQRDAGRSVWNALWGRASDEPAPRASHEHPMRHVGPAA